MDFSSTLQRWCGCQTGKTGGPPRKPHGLLPKGL